MSFDYFVRCHICRKEMPQAGKGRKTDYYNISVSRLDLFPSSELSISLCPSCYENTDLYKLQIRIKR